MPREMAAETPLSPKHMDLRKPVPQSLQGCFQLQQDMFAGRRPQSTSSDTPAWGWVVGEVTKAALFQANICRGLGTAPSSCSSAAAGRQLERLFAEPQHQRWPRPPLARLEVLIHAWLTKHLSWQAGALDTNLHKGKHCPRWGWAEQ